MGHVTALAGLAMTACLGQLGTAPLAMDKLHESEEFEVDGDKSLVALTKT
jgi:hypothetical protein